VDVLAPRMIAQIADSWSAAVSSRATQRRDRPAAVRVPAAEIR